jgi:hypothetical protein
MVEDPNQVECARHLLQWAAEQTARSQDLTKVAHEACTRAASLCTESAILLDEIRFRCSTLR